MLDSLTTAIEYAQKYHANTKCFIIGGGQIYKQSLPLANRMYITRIHADIQGDVEFPKIDGDAWQQIASSSRHEADNHNEYDYTFAEYLRKDMLSDWSINKTTIG